MKKNSCFLLLLSLFGTTLSFAQVKEEWNGIFKSINEEVQNNSKAYTTLKEATETIGHRLTGSKNGEKAESYAYQLLKSYGFKDVRYQLFEVESWSRGTLSVHTGANVSALKEVKSVTLAHSPVAADITLEVVDMGNGLEEDYLANPYQPW